MLSPENLYKRKSLDQESDYCEISIQDNGIGFDQKFSDQIFLIFHRLHGKSEYEGTGIGLALCKKIVINHHGEIYASSKESEGALFVMLLPLRHPSKSTDNGKIRITNPQTHGKI